MIINTLKPTLIKDYISNQKSIVTIGTFDGVHIGHQEIIKQLLKQSQKYNLTSVLLTFFPHPRMVLQQNKDIKLINTIEERGFRLKKNGIDSVVIQDFNKELSEMTALAFVRDILVSKLNAKRVLVGYNHRFGNNRVAGINELIKFGKVFDFEVSMIPPQTIDSVAVSSTKIRNALNQADMIKARKYLGYYFTISGKVINGQALGRTIGFPTANIALKENYKIVPPNGIYVVSSEIDGQLQFGMMNIGVRPTVGGKNKTIEVHFFDLNKNLYDRQLTISVLKYLRKESDFKQIDKLKAQLSKDREQAIHFIEKEYVK